MAIIFNGEKLVAHHHEGNGDVLLVTFIGAFHEEAAETHYLMREAVERNHLDCVGVTARVRNLFVSDEIYAIAERARALRRPEQKVVVIGQSTGGYAAVKFAQAFGADYVLSFAPLYSLDVTDLGLTPDMTLALQVLEQGLRFHRVPPEIVRTGMHPTREDCPAPVVFVYDTVNETDSYAADLYERVFPDARFVRAPHVGHAIVNNIGDAEFVMSLIELVVADDLDAACVLLKRAARNSDIAIAELVARIARWRPAMALRALETPRARDFLRDPVRRTHIYNTVLAYELAARGDAAAASAHLRRVNEALFARDATGSGLFLVISTHGDVLGYDTGNTQVVLSPHVLHQNNGVPVLLDLRGEAPRTVIQLSSGDLEVVTDAGTASESGPGFTVENVPGSSLVAFRRGASFLHGQPFNVALFSASAVEGWERFALVPVPDLATGGDKSGMNWLDERIVAVRVGDAKPRSAAAQAETASRKALFRSFMRLFGG